MSSKTLFFFFYASSTAQSKVKKEIYDAFLAVEEEETRSPTPSTGLKGGLVNLGRGPPASKPPISPKERHEAGEGAGLIRGPP